MKSLFGFYSKNKGTGKTLLLLLIFGLLSVFWPGAGRINTVMAQDLIVFPAKNQSPEQTEKDKFGCYTWAKQQSHFDPMQAQQQTQTAPPQSQGPGGERIRGAARGAAVGAVVGKIANDDAGKGAAAGAAGGAMIGGMRKRQKRRQQAQAQEQKAQQGAAAHAQKRDTYNRAYSACLEGKGYTVK
jgi:hypothetical protein